MRAFLYAGGPVYPEFITEHPKADDLRIAADSGLRAADALSDRVDILVGDFDSLGEPPARAGMEVVRVPAEKDLTDTQLALEIAVSRGADEIILIAGLSGRLDHTLSTLSVLEDMHARGLHGYITDGQNRVHFLQSSSLLIARSAFRYLSLIAADPVVRGPLSHATLRRSLQFAVSNEITGNAALVSCKKGSLYVIESADRR